MTVRGFVLGAAVLLCLLTAGCHTQKTSAPVIEFTQIPEAGPGVSNKMEPIAGRVKGAQRGQQIVVLARSGTWWVQPYSHKPFTAIRDDSTWQTSSHPGDEYAALLVAPGFVAPGTMDALPSPGGGVIAVARAPGSGPAVTLAVPPKIYFSGYEWEVMQTSTDSGGVLHTNSPSNVWTDARGWLHLRIHQDAGQWTCAELILKQALGYGTYSFFLKAVKLEPGDVLGMFTWDPLDAGQNHREIDIELSQWGDPAAKNGQFTIQPYYVPANVFRFVYPGAAAAYSFQWRPESAFFQGIEASTSRIFAAHDFTSGIPSTGGERVHINLYTYGKSRTPQREGVEVVIEKFSYLP